MAPSAVRAPTPEATPMATLRFMCCFLNIQKILLLLLAYTLKFFKFCIGFASTPRVFVRVQCQLNFSSLSLGFWARRFVFPFRAKVFISSTIFWWRRSLPSQNYLLFLIVDGLRKHVIPNPSVEVSKYFTPGVVDASSKRLRPAVRQSTRSSTRVHDIYPAQISSGFGRRPGRWHWPWRWPGFRPTFGSVRPTCGPTCGPTFATDGCRACTDGG